MRIICPHAGDPYPETLLSLAASDYPVEMRDTSTSGTAYADLLMHLWGDRKPFTIVEQDIAFQPEQLRSPRRVRARLLRRR